MTDSVAEHAAHDKSMSNLLLTCAKLNQAIAYRKIGDCYVVVMTDDGSMVFLNQTAGEVLEMLDGGVAEVDVPLELSRRYGIEVEVAERDFLALYRGFCELGLIVAVGTPTLKSTADDSPRATVGESDLRDGIKAHCVRASIPLQAFVEVTRACNLRCTHCYLPPSEMTRTLRRDVIDDLLDQLRDAGCLEVVFTGGEPLAHKRFLSNCQRARDLRFSVVVKTNATLLDDDTLAAFRRMHITEVQVSLYSMKPQIHDAITGRVGSHAQTVDALRRCSAVGQRCRISCVVMRTNFQHLGGLKDFAREIGAPIGFDLVVTRCHDGSTASLDERLTPDDLRWLDENEIMANVIFEGSGQVRRADEATYGLQEFPIEDPNSPVCGAACTLVAIDASGAVRPCIAFPWSLGNVREQPLAEILSDANERARNIRKLRNSSFEECKGCSLVAACPRCMATIYQETGSPTGKADAICRIAVYHSRYGGQ